MRAATQGCRTGSGWGDQRQTGLAQTPAGNCRHRHGQPGRPELGRRRAVRHPDPVRQPSQPTPSVHRYHRRPVARRQTRREGVFGIHRQQYRPWRTRVHPLGAREYVLPLGWHHCPSRLHPPHPVQVWQPLRHLPRGQSWPTRRSGLGSGPLPGPARRRNRGRTQNRKDPMGDPQRPHRTKRCSRSARY